MRSSQLRDLAMICFTALLAVVLSAPALLHAQSLFHGHEIRVVTGDSGPATREIVDTLRRRYPALHEAMDPRLLASRKGPGIYLAIGPSALHAALASGIDGPIVSLFCSSQTYMELLAQTPTKMGRTVTAIYAESAPDQQMQLIAQLFGRQITVATLLSEKTWYLEPLVRSAAHSADLKVRIEKLKPDDNIAQALTRAGVFSALLAVPDSSLFTPENLRTILESTYRRNQAVVGFSTAAVKAGTTATAYSTIDDVVAQLDPMLVSVASGSIPKPQFPRYWRVAINESVARSLNIVVNDEVRGLGERPSEKLR